MPKGMVGRRIVPAAGHIAYYIQTSSAYVPITRKSSISSGKKKKPKPYISMLKRPATVSESARAHCYVANDAAKSPWPRRIKGKNISASAMWNACARNIGGWSRPIVSTHSFPLVLPLFCRNACQTHAVRGRYVPFSRIWPASTPHTAREMVEDGEKLVGD